jgi:histidinol-phosphate/aromatic aminotransferase/cobyric acid decarboxylase-like protein
VAPYVTFRVGDAPAVQGQLMYEHRVLVRDCTSFGLPDRIRVAVHPEVPWLG